MCRVALSPQSSPREGGWWHSYSYIGISHLVHLDAGGIHLCARDIPRTCSEHNMLVINIFSYKSLGKSKIPAFSRFLVLCLNMLISGEFI